jgi:hypothetical protein
MAKSKLTVKDIRAHFFMSIIGNQVELVYHDDYENGAGLGAALSSIMEEDDKLFDIFSAALLTACETRDNNPNWEKVKIAPKKKDNPKQMNRAKSDKPFVKTRKTTKK